MKRLTAVGTGVLAALLVAAPVSAGPTSGDTDLIGSAVAGTTLLVDASIKSIVPVVPYGYAIQNECTGPGRKDASYQRDDIVYWTSEDAEGPHAIMPIYLQSVEAGASCKVFLIKNNTVVKGSTTKYDVTD